jgi:3-oxoacyl-[acyl-carrier protein] reductase
MPVDRVAIVTGGSRGIGAAVVHELAARGVHVLFTYGTNAAAAADVAARAAAARSDVVPAQHDLLTGDPEALVRQAIQRWGRLDSLVLNAGIWAGGRIDRLDPDRWWEVVETNLRGAHGLTRAAVPALRASPAGSVVLVASAVGLVGFPGDTAYASAKSAMVGFGRSLAKELGSAGVRVNVLAPGFVETDMTAAIPPGSRDRILDRTVLGRFGTSAEVAKAAVFLAEDATFTTGAVLTVDGGWTL